MIDVFKCQKPLFRGHEVLVYMEEKKIMLLLPYDKNWRKLFGDKLKIYVSAKYTPKVKTLDIIRVLPDRNW